MTGATHTRETLLEAVRSTVGTDYEVLGEMSRVEGGGLVFFAREGSTNKIVALQLDRDSEESYSIHVTRVLKPVARPSTRDAAASRISLVQRPDVSQRRPPVEVPRKPVEPAPRVARRAEDVPNRRATAPPQPTLQFDTRMKVALIVIGVLVLALLISLLG